jgi:hypothetical protein
MGRMRIPTRIAASALMLALLAVCACTDQVGLAHGDPGRDSAPQTPLLGADSSNATVASAPAVPLSNASPTPLPRSTLQPSLPEINAAAASASAAGIPKVFSAVTVTLSEHAQELAAADPRLTATEVATAVEHEMAAQQLLAPGTAAPPLAITVDDLTSTLASNASVLGYTFRNVILIGDVTVTGPAGRATIDVHARARLTSRDASGRSGSLGPLYTRFAQLVVADLRGVAPPSADLPR